jgi:hypothetical protein
MKAETFVALGLAVWTLPAAAARAETPERPSHYEAEAPKTVQDALSLLDDKVKAVEETLARQAPDAATLESVHEQSYALEASVDKLREDGGAAANEAKEIALDSLDEAVQALHYASENRQADKVNEWFAKLKKAAEEVLASFKFNSKK